MQLSVMFDATPQSIDEAIASLKQIKAGLVMSSRIAYIEKWWGHLGQTSRDFWKYAAQTAASTPHFTLQDIAHRHANTAVASLRASLMNSHKAIKDEQAPDPMPGIWDSLRGCNVYQMSEEVCQEILRLAA